MKKTSIIAEGVKGVAVLAAAFLLLTGCAFTDHGNNIKDEREALEALERKREDYESRYVIVLNSLERNIGDPKLELERDRIRKKILELNTSIEDQRQIFERGVQDWEKKISQDKLQKEMDGKEMRNNAYKEE